MVIITRRRTTSSLMTQRGHSGVRTTARSSSRTTSSLRTAAGHPGVRRTSRSSGGRTTSALQTVRGHAGAHRTSVHRSVAKHPVVHRKTKRTTPVAHHAKTTRARHVSIPAHVKRIHAKHVQTARRHRVEQRAVPLHRATHHIAKHPIHRTAARRPVRHAATRRRRTVTR